MRELRIPAIAVLASVGMLLMAPSTWAQEPLVPSIDGTGNNLAEPRMGAAYTQLRRYLAADYGDGLDDPEKPFRPGPREISNAVNAQRMPVWNRHGSSDYLWQWGQFLDHDIDLTAGMTPPEPMPIPVPTGDPFFDPEGLGGQIIPFHRSIYDPATGLSLGNPRQQLNEITHWIDASNVYGSDETRAAALRTDDGTGRLKLSEDGKDLLPNNVDGLPNQGGPGATLFLAGDVRANEQVGLTALHTLFVREHNRLADLYRAQNPTWSGDQIYAAARRYVIALMQVITYREFLPALLGPHGLPDYGGYDPSVDARIMNAFSTAAFRFGHSALNATLLRLGANGRAIPEGHLALRDAFFAPDRIRDDGGIEPILRGLAAQRCQRIDPLVIDDVRNFLFGLPGQGGFDLASMNIQRGRDHGLPSYNDVREHLGFGRAQRFSDISPRRSIQRRLRAVYDSVDDVDGWIGGLAEEPLPGAHVGRLFRTIIAKQFQALRDGDRFWYALLLDAEEIEEVEQTRLSDIIRRNTGIGDEIQDDVFYVWERSRATSRTVMRNAFRQMMRGMFP